MQILLCYKSAQAEDPAACHMGMGVTASNTALALRESRIEAEAKAVQNGEYLWAKLANEWNGATHVVLCAPYIDPKFLDRLASNFRKIQFALAYHSNLGFLTVDRFAAESLPSFRQIESGLPNFRVAANCAELADAISAASAEPFLHLPNLYHLPHIVRRHRPRWSPGMDLHLGLFGAARVLKNWLTAATGAMILQRRADSKTYLHVSTGRDEGAGGTRAALQALLRLNPNVTLIESPWQPVDDFRRSLYGIDLLLQPSFTETFNNVTADGAACGVPSVVSEAVYWAPEQWIARADSATDIARVGWSILMDKRAAERGWNALDRYNSKAISAWKEWLEA